MSLDDADGGMRCGGVLTARREDGHAHDWGVEGLDLKLSVEGRR